jgi:flagellar P-ring protein precursor FlgI
MAAAIFVSPADAVRIKDICSYEGVRGNQLVGYGLVVGLKQTGDDMGTEFTRQSLVSFLRRNNIQVDLKKVKVDNVAAVMVTATLPPFAKQGAKIDVVVSSIGDAETLQGGILIATPLYPVAPGENGERIVYAVAQGAISTGGFAAQQGGSSVVKNHPTTALIPGGATVEREVQTAFATKPEIALMLGNPDFTTADRIAQLINATEGSAVAEARNSGAVALKMPAGGPSERVKFLARIEGLEVSPDGPARVVYNERTGTIVMGGNVRISTTIVTHGNLTISKQDIPANIPVQPFTPPGTQPILDRYSTVATTEEKGTARVLQEGVTVGEVAKALNALGVSARDIIPILQALKECGALQAELVAM